MQDAAASTESRPVADESQAALDDVSEGDAPMTPPKVASALDSAPASDDDELKAKRLAVEAVVAAAREAYGQPEDARSAAMAAKRAEVAAAVAAALAARKAGKAPAHAEAARQQGGNSEVRKVTAKDLFGFDARAEEKQSVAPDVKDYRMQGNYGATKFIKP